MHPARPRARALRGARAPAGALLVALAVLAGCGGDSEPASSTPQATGAARGKQLYTADGCSSCHTIDGSKSTGPTFKGLAGSTVRLESGRRKADRAYLRRAITDPDADIVAGYPKGLMSAAVNGLDLRTKPDDVDALVAYIETLR
jgi:mono/diheme cytochrome c family protein